MPLNTVKEDFKIFGDKAALIDELPFTVNLLTRRSTWQGKQVLKEDVAAIHGSSWEGFLESCLARQAGWYGLNHPSSV